MALVPNFPFDQYEDLILSFLSHQIYLAPLLLLFLEEAGVPFSVADFVIAYTGYQVAMGHISFFIAFLLLLVTDLTGASILFYLCSRFGEKVINKFGKFIDLDHKKLEIVEKYFRKFGPLFIIFGRHVIGLRIPITIFSGISKMNYFVFIGSTFISVILWIYFYLSLGIHLGPRTVHLIREHGWDWIFILLPIILSLAPFFFLRKKHHT